jgi:hypothetical protein
MSARNTILSWVTFACAAVAPSLEDLEAVPVPCVRLAAGQFTVADILMTNVRFGYQRQCLPAIFRQYDPQVAEVAIAPDGRALSNSPPGASGVLQKLQSWGRW